MNTQRAEATATRQGKWWEINLSDLGTRTAAPPTDRMEAIVGVLLLRAITIWFTAWGTRPKSENLIHSAINVRQAIRCRNGEVSW
jgi:hypothetical protein